MSLQQDSTCVRPYYSFLGYCRVSRYQLNQLLSGLMKLKKGFCKTDGVSLQKSTVIL